MGEQPILLITSLLITFLSPAFQPCSSLLWDIYTVVSSINFFFLLMLASLNLKLWGVLSLLFVLGFFGLAWFGYFVVSASFLGNSS